MDAERLKRMVAPDYNPATFQTDEIVSMARELLSLRAEVERLNHESRNARDLRRVIGKLGMGEERLLPDAELGQDVAFIALVIDDLRAARRAQPAGEVKPALTQADLEEIEWERARQADAEGDVEGSKLRPVGEPSPPRSPASAEALPSGGETVSMDRAVEMLGHAHENTRAMVSLQGEAHRHEVEALRQQLFDAERLAAGALKRLARLSATAAPRCEDEVHRAAVAVADAALDGRFFVPHCPEFPVRHAIFMRAWAAYGAARALQTDAPEEHPQYAACPHCIEWRSDVKTHAANAEHWRNRATAYEAQLNNLTENLRRFIGTNCGGA